MLVRSRKQTPVFIVIPFHTTPGSSRVQSRTILAPSWNWHSALGFSLGLSRTTLAPPWSWHSALGFGFAVESDNASPTLELAFGTRSSISRGLRVRDMRKGMARIEEARSQQGRAGAGAHNLLESHSHTDFAANTGDKQIILQSIDQNRLKKQKRSARTFKHQGRTTQEEKELE
ncbi:hypothetical protein B0H17DRAFT_1178037 [Mycena rosella]|uniref:Uncharacterized protein n=1 Tax=Mycena rosella TaxID=1033263 RepID=A0AAD7DNC8_MYCRO|nr:hypothetical protein B0H17DRAFT_1178037 [Mycena rosella]